MIKPPAHVNGGSRAVRVTGPNRRRRLRASPTQAGQQPPAAGVHIVKNLYVDGNGYYRRIIDATIESCSSACVADAQCKMFSYWQAEVCYLFDKKHGFRSYPASQVGLVR
jgi:hypothetical protein